MLLRIHEAPVLDEGGTPRAVQGVAERITEPAAKITPDPEDERDARAGGPVFDNMALAMFTFDTEGRVEKFIRRYGLQDQYADTTGEGKPSQQ